ncbi:hypothetical protein ACFVJ8_28380 [Streptomyces yangpuensis]|uniref:hypothetical protein n=1 Tax=Streptomyces yangpuensis TaxID=1648182 RepID=UPI00362DA4D4
MTASRTTRRHPRTRTRTGKAAAVRALALAVCLAVTTLATGCREDTAPAWDYPRLAATLNALSTALAQGCATPDPDHCAGSLDRLDTLARRAFTEVLDHRLLDQACLDAESDVRRARTLRLAAAITARSPAPAQSPARSLQDPHRLALARAVAAEQAAYRRLLAALEKVRATPPPGAVTGPA